MLRYSTARAAPKFLHHLNAGYATAAPRFDAQRAEGGARKSPQVERAIRIKSQQRKRAVRSAQYAEANDKWKSRSPALRGDRRADRLGDGHSRRPTASRPSPSRNTYARHDSGEPRAGHPRSSLPRKDGSKRRATFEKLMTLERGMKGRQTDRENALDEAQEVFQSLSPSARKDNRIYTAMIRVKLAAGKRRDAIALYHAMKKDGVAADVFTQMAILRAASWVEFATPGETQLIKEVQKVFKDMERDFQEAITTGRPDMSVDPAAELNETSSSATAISYSRSRKQALQEMWKATHVYAASCGYYMAFLLNINDCQAAIALLKKGKELAAPRGALEAIVPQLPYILAGRFLSGVLRKDVEQDEDLISGIVYAFNVTVNALLKTNRKQMEKGLDWTASERKTEEEVLERKRTEIDGRLYEALSCLEKFQVPERERIAAEALESLQEDEELVSLPAITVVGTLRAAMVLALKQSPQLCVDFFENAVDYHIAAAEQMGASPDVNSKLYLRDLRDVWTTYPLTALLTLNDLDRALNLIRKKKFLSGKATLLSTDVIPRPYFFGHLMRKIFEARDWERGLDVWREYARDVVDEVKSADDMTASLFITHFLDLSVKHEQKMATEGDAAKLGKMNERPTRIALELLEKDVGLDSERLWGPCEQVLSEQSKRAREKREIKETESENNKTEQMCISLLRRLSQVGKLAITNEKPGALDPSERRDVEVWKDMVRRAAHLRAQIEGKQSFDGEEAKWVRSGGRGRATLALTDDDLREMLN